MAEVLEGGCRVSTMHEGTPRIFDSLKIWNQIDEATGAQAISLRILEFAPGASQGLRNDECDEVLYSLENLDDDVTSATCTVSIDGVPHEVEPRTGIYVRSGQTFSVENHGPDAVWFVSSQCPGSLDNPAIVGIGSWLTRRLAASKSRSLLDRSRQVARPIIFTSTRKCYLFCVVRDEC